MRKIRVWLMRFVGLFAKQQRDHELAEELESNLQMHIEDNLRAGMSPQEARRQALIQLGGMEQAKEKYRERRGLPALESLWQDVRFGMRALRKSPGFTIAAVITLALGIGANTAIFSVVNSLLLRPLPVKDAGQITVLVMQQKNQPLSQYFSYPDYLEISGQSMDAFSGVLAYRIGIDGLSVNGHADHILTSFVTGNFFTELGIQPYLGRLILPNEGATPNADPVIVLGYDYWKARFGGDPGVVGESVSVDGHAFTIIGVTPKSFHGLNVIANMQAYLPMGMATIEGFYQNDFMADRNGHSYTVVGRLKPRVSLEQANAGLSVIGHRLAQEHPKEDAELTLSAYPERLARPAPLPNNPVVAASALFLALAGLVLLLACFNVANLLLVRGTVRRREMAIRTALGGTRGRLVRQLLTESLLLALLGGAAGILIGEWGSSAISSINFHTDLPILMNFGFDWRVFAYALAAALLTGVVVGTVPAIRASRSDFNEVLHERGRSVSGKHQRLRSALVVAEIAGSLILLIVAGLFTRSLENAQHMDLGFNPNGVLNLTMDPQEVGYSQAQGIQFYKALLDKMSALPGVESASLAFSVPAGETFSSISISVAGYTLPAGQPAPTIFNNVVTPDYFRTMQMPIVRGRAFSEADSEKAQRVAIVNQTMAQRFWPHEDPIGRLFADMKEPDKPYQIVGIVKDATYFSIFQHGDPYIYMPLAQNYAPLETLQIRTAMPPSSIIAEAQKEIATLAPTLPVFDMQTMTDSLGSGQGFLIFRLGAALAATLGTLGLALVLVGVYGVVSYSASQRTHEIGVRLALGARPGDIHRMVFRQGIFMVGAGLILGLLGALSASRVVGKFLVGVNGMDPLTFGSVAALLALVTLAACWIPARRAMRVDPMVALRYE